MDDDEFWEIVDKAEGDPDKLRNILKKKTADEIRGFDDKFFEKLRNIPKAAVEELVEDKGYVGDFIDYTKYNVIAEGRETFEEVLENPESILEVEENELYAYVADRLYGKKKVSALEEYKELPNGKVELDERTRRGKKLEGFLVERAAFPETGIESYEIYYEIDGNHLTHENVEQAAKVLKQKFGDSVKVEILDGGRPWIRARRILE